METDKFLLEFWRRHKWTVLCGIIALLFAVSVITYGFFQALFIFLCIGAGLYGGWKLDQRMSKKNKAEDRYFDE